MAGISNSDYIQQQLLDQSVAVNDNLTAMRTVLLDINKNVKRGGAGGGGNTDPDPGPGAGNRRRNRRGGSGGPSGSFKDVFKTMFGEASAAGRTILGNNASTSNVAGALTTSVGSITKSLSMIPGPVGAAASVFNQIVKAGGMLYEYMNQQLTMYNQVNSAGLTLKDGVTTLQKGAAGAFMSVNEFSAALQKNSDAIAVMEGQYDSGVEHFGNLLNTVQLAQKQMGLYGVSQQQLADLTAKNYKYDKMYAGQAAMRNMSESQSTEKFVGQMTYLSKSVGKSVDELLKTLANMGDNLDSSLSISSLQDAFGFSPEKAAEVNKTFVGVYSSMGEAGNNLQKIMSSKLMNFSLPDEYVGGTFLSSYTDMIKQLQAQGITDEKQVREIMNQWTTEHGQLLEKEKTASARAGQTQLAALLAQIQQQNNIFNSAKDKTTPLWEQLTNNVNLWIGESITKPMNDAFTDMKDRTAKYLIDLAANSDGAWDFTAKLVRDSLKAIPKIFNDGMLYLQNLLEGWGQSLFGDTYTQVSNEFETFMNNLLNLPTMLWDSITGWWNSSFEDKINGVKDAASSVWDGIKGAFSNIGNTTPPGQEQTKQSFMEMYNSLNDKLNSYLNKFKSWWNGDDDKPTTTPPVPPQAKNTPAPTASQPKTAGNTNVSAPPEYTKPVKVEQADQTSPETQTQTANNSTDDATKLLQQMLNSLESQSATASQLNILLRQIAENTEPPRNV